MNSPSTAGEDDDPAMRLSVMTWAFSSHAVVIYVYVSCLFLFAVAFPWLRLRKRNCDFPFGVAQQLQQPQA